MVVKIHGESEGVFEVEEGGRLGGEFWCVWR
jgi:hypothetical protein